LTVSDEKIYLTSWCVLWRLHSKSWGIH